MVRLADHYHQIKSLFRDSYLLSGIAIIALFFSLFGFLFNAVLTESQKSRIGEFMRSMLEFWQWFLVAFLCSIIVVLYRRVFPRVLIRFDAKDQWHQTVQNGVRKFRVDLVNRGPFQENISFRLDRIQLDDGSYHPTERRGFQREAAVGPMPLSPSSPKAGYLVQLDETSPSSEIEVLTTKDLAGGYAPDPIRLARGKYKLHVSLSPRSGQPYETIFAITTDDGRLNVQQMPAS